MTNKKILLVNPPSPFLADEKVFPTLGLGYLYSALKASGEEVSYVDLAGMPDEEIRSQRALFSHYDAIGLTATSPQFFNAYRILGFIKERNPTQRVVIGGSHASMVSTLRKKSITALKYNLAPRGLCPYRLS